MIQDQCKQPAQKPNCFERCTSYLAQYFECDRRVDDPDLAINGEFHVEDFDMQLEKHIEDVNSVNISERTLPEIEKWFSNWNSFKVWFCCVQEEQLAGEINHTRSNIVQEEKEAFREDGFLTKNIVPMESGMLANDSNSYSFGCMPEESIEGGRGHERIKLRTSKQAMELYREDSAETAENLNMKQTGISKQRTEKTSPTLLVKSEPLKYNKQTQKIDSDNARQADLVKVFAKTGSSKESPPQSDRKGKPTLPVRQNDLPTELKINTMGIVQENDQTLNDENIEEDEGVDIKEAKTKEFRSTQINSNRESKERESKDNDPDKLVFVDGEKASKLARVRKRENKMMKTLMIFEPGLATVAEQSEESKYPPPRATAEAVAPAEQKKEQKKRNFFKRIPKDIFISFGQEQPPSQHNPSDIP